MIGAFAGLSMIAGRLAMDVTDRKRALQWWVNEKTGNHWATEQAANKPGNWLNQNGVPVLLISANLWRDPKTGAVYIIDYRWAVGSSEYAHHSPEEKLVIARWGLRPIE